MIVAALLALGGASVLALAVGLRRDQIVVWGVAMLGAAYALSLAERHGVRNAITAPLIAGAMIGCSEGAYLAIERDGAPVQRRIAWIAGVALGSTVVSAIVLDVATIHVARSLTITVLGTLAVVAAVALLRALTRRTTSQT